METTNLLDRYAECNGTAACPKHVNCPVFAATLNLERDKKQKAPEGCCRNTEEPES